MPLPQTESRDVPTDRRADPPPADYADDRDDAFYENVDDAADQDELSGGRTVRSFDWKR